MSESGPLVGYLIDQNVITEMLQYDFIDAVAPAFYE